MVERRQYKRFAAFLNVKCVESDNQAEKIKCRSFNIGEGGIGIYSEKQLKRGDLYNLEIRLPGAENNIPATAEVIWSKSISPYCYNSGLYLLDISSTDRRRLVDAAFAD